MAEKYGTIKAAIETYGEDHQINLAIEEMSELTKALLKYQRAINEGNPPEDSEEFRILLDHVDEEMADVMIMMSQLRLIFDNADAVSLYKSTKLKRLAQRLEANDK